MLANKEKPNDSRLKVQEALQEEAYKGIVRIDSQTMRQIGVRAGDIIEIEGGRKTLGIADRAYPTDIGQSIIRMDGILRRNARTGIGELVIVRRADIKEAKSIIIAPAQQGVMIQADPEIFKRGLLGRPIIKGDIISMGGARSRRRTMAGTQFEDIFEDSANIFDVFSRGFGGFGLGNLKFIVAETNPKQAVIVTENTEITLSSKSIQIAEESHVPEVTYEDIGGLTEEVKKIREMVELPLKHPELFEKLGVEPPKGVLLHGPPGCLTGETLVALEDGRLVRMEEIGKNLIPGIHIADLPIYPPASAKAIHIYDVPETIEVILKRGKRIRMTPNHPLMTNESWKEAEKLKVDDKVKILNWIPSPINYVPINFILDEKRVRGHCIIPAIWDERLALLLGIFTAEGSVEKWRIKFTINKKEKELKETIIDLISKLFEVKVTELPDPQKNALRLRFSHRYLEDFFRRFWQKEKMIPTPILLSPNSVAANFLRGLFEGDGSVVKSSPKYDRCITLKSKSRKLVEEVQILLLRWSIRSSILKYVSKFWGEVYTLKITGRSNLLKFKENIEFLSEEKKEKLNNLIVSYKLARTNEDISEYEPIKEIKKIHGWQRVYDFEVPTTNSFFSNGVLSHNTGKTLLAKAVANESEANFLLINGPELTSKFYGETEKRIREIFSEAEKNAPSIIFIDEIDSIAPKREETYGEVERRMVSQLLTMMDGLKGRGKVVVIGATNRPNAIDPALRRPGRFDREINTGVPNRKGRLNILQIHTRNMPFGDDIDLERLAEITHGFVGADIAALTKEAAMNVLRRILPNIDLKDESELSPAILEKLVIKSQDFNEALKIVRPSALREVLIESPNVHWEEIGGLEQLKQELKEAVEWPLKHPQVFTTMGIRAPRGILLYGPPGTGKTLLAKAVASESEANFIYIKGPELISKWVGDSEKGIRKVFEKARQASPAIIFFDELDAIANTRGMDEGSHATGRVVNQLLTEMDGLQELTNVVVIGATNRVDMIDPALLRPGRFDKILSTPIPSESGRERIFRIHTSKMPIDYDSVAKEDYSLIKQEIKNTDSDEEKELTNKDIFFIILSKKTQGYVGADIEAVCREAALIALRKNLESRQVKMENFEEALKKTKPSIRGEVLKVYEEMEEDYINKARASIQKVPTYLG